MILYFSGTGNSRYIAEQIAGTVHDDLLSINEKIRNQDTREVTAGERLVFVLPTYAWRIPRIVEQWVKSVRFAGPEYLPVWFVMSCGDEIGNAPKYLRRLCAEKGWTYRGAAQIVMPENYIAMFQVPKPSTARKIIRNAQPEIQAAAETIAAGEAFANAPASMVDRCKSSLINPAFYRLFVKAGAFRAEADCTGCGRCARECPLGNIVLKEGRPVWGLDCTHCMACISLCPSQAIEYGSKSKGKPRYHIDRIGLEESVATEIDGCE